MLLFLQSSLKRVQKDGYGQRQENSTNSVTCLNTVPKSNKGAFPSLRDAELPLAYQSPHFSPRLSTNSIAETQYLPTKPLPSADRPENDRQGKSEARGR